jgi:hypothetical protein
LLPFVHDLAVLGIVAPDTGLLDLRLGMTANDRGVAFPALYRSGHHVGVGFLLARGFPGDEPDLPVMTVGAFGSLLVMAAQAFHPCFDDLPVFLAGGLANAAIQDPGDMLSVWKGKPVHLDLHILVSLVAFGAFRMGGLDIRGQGNRPFRMADRTAGLVPPVALKTGLFRRPKGRRVMGIVVDIVMTGCAGVLQLLNVEEVRYGDLQRINLWGGPLHFKDTGVTTDAVRVDLVEFRRKTSVFASALEREDVDAGHEGMAGGMALGAVDLGVEG